MVDDVTKPPVGLLAERALKNAAAAESAAPPEDKVTTTPSPTILPVDPNYNEPTTLAVFREMHEKISREACEAVTTEGAARILLERKVLIDFLLGRIEVLEAALKPFCVVGTMMSNALMCLLANDNKDPAGGTWISNPPNGIQLQPNAGYFYNAIDALGRKSTENHIALIFQRVQEANVLQAEKQSHIDGGGALH